MFDLSAMGIREQAMLLVGVLAILVMLRGFYVAWRIRRRQARLMQPAMRRQRAEAPEVPGAAPVSGVPAQDTPELTGESRVVGRREGNAAAWQLEKARRHAAALGLRDGGGSSGAGEARQIPILMDAVELGDSEDAAALRRPSSVQRPSPQRQSARAAAERKDADNVDSTAAGATADATAGATTGATTDSPLEEILVVNVMAKGGNDFAGEKLLEVLMTAGLRFGDMDIFHYPLDPSREDEPPVFSVANILNPGTFDLDSIETFHTPGLSLFLVIPSPKNDQQAFDDMLRIAEHIKDAFAAELRDDRRNIMTAQTVEHYRQRIRDFELHRLQQAAANKPSSKHKTSG